MAGGKIKSGKKHKHNKGKRWKKGQSCVTNPNTNTHRQAAKNRFFNVVAGPSDLTVDALAKHDADDRDNDGDVVFSDAASSVGRSVGGKTFSTWASNWTECTNTTFSKVHRYMASNSALHKEMLAVLAAVTEVIKARGGNETETEYFAALMTALESVDTEESMAAIAQLLSVCLKRVPHAVLKSKFSEVSKALLDILVNHVDTNTSSLLRSTLMCLAQVLRVQEQAIWNNASTMHTYNGLLQFCIHPKPKVRKAAQQAVRAVLRGSVFMTGSDPPPYHPATSATAKYCIQQIEECGGHGEVTVTLYVLGLLSDILGTFPQNSLKSACETILRVMTLANVMVTSVSMKALHGMFLSEPKPSCLPAELNAQIITALYDYQPGLNDVQQMSAWLTVMEMAHVNLAKVNEKLCVSHLPRLFAAAMACMTAEKREVAQAAAKTLKSLLQSCVAQAADGLAANLQSTPSSVQNTPAHKMFRAVEGGLSYQYHAVWDLVLGVLNVFFQVLGKQCHLLMKKCLLSMADLRDSHQFPHQGELDRAVGMAIRTMGPRVVLEAIPLNIKGEDDDYSFPRSWLLPVLRANVQDTELAFFTTYFLPLAAKLRTKSIEFAKNNRVVEAKTYDALQSQIWSLLPGFCIRPTDIASSFKGLARILGSAITDREDIRLEVMGSLRKLINNNLQHEENRAELGKFAKNYLPLLFNLVTSESDSSRDSSRLAALETVKCYVQIADPELAGTFFDKCLDKLKEDDISEFRKHALMDLVIGMIPFVGEKRLKQVYPLITSQLKSTDRTIQKKSYRVLEEICSGHSEDSKSFISFNLGELQSCLLKSLSSSSSSSKAPRLRCLIHIFRNLDEPHLDFMAAVVPEAILCTKEIAEKARQAAFVLLTEMGKASVRWAGPVSDGSDIGSKVIGQYLELLMAGLAGSPHMICCTVLALSKVLYDFRDIVDSALLDTLVASLCVLLASKSREIVQSALSLAKVLLSCFSEAMLAQFLHKLVTSLVSMKEDNNHHFRFKAKEIFTKLIRRFGYQLIVSMVPASHQKMLGNIRKTEERRKRKKSGEKGEEESEDEEEKPIRARPETIDELLRDTDSELEDDQPRRAKGQAAKKANKKSGKAWLQEGGEDDIVDFLDPSVAKKVMATKPDQNAAKSQGVKHDFKKAADGRLIINEGESDDEKKPKKGKKKDAMEIDDIDELLDAMGGLGKKSRKRKMGDEMDMNEEEEAGPMKYRAGGSGIHRPMGKKTREPGAEYKAKKAGGDTKKEGKHDPYAYIPLQFQKLNKRKRAKMTGQFKSFVRGAQKGAEKGKKMRFKNKK